MKSVLVILIMTLSFTVFSQKTSSKVITQLYISVLEYFENSPLKLHEKDNEILVSKAECDDMILPEKVGNSNVKWFCFDEGLSKVLKGDMKLHNGRSVILISYKQPSRDTIKVRIDQRTLKNIGKGTTYIPINEDIHPEYKSKNHNYFFVKIDSNWRLAKQTRRTNPITEKAKIVEDLFQKGNSLSRQGKYKKALECVEKSMALDSSLYQRYMFRATLKIKIGNFDSAISDVTTCLERCECSTKNIHVASYYLKRAEIHILNNDSFSARNDVDKSISLNPNNWKSYSLRATLLFASEDYKDALTDLNKSIDLNKNQADIYFLRGAVHLKIGNKGKACADFLIAIESGNEEPRNWVEENCE